jgi:ribosomal protein S21
VQALGLSFNYFLITGCNILSVKVEFTPMIQVTRKDSKESVENLVRRFTRKVQQAGIVTATKQSEFFEKPMSKRDRRTKAIIRRERKALKIKKLKLGQK